MEQHLTDGLDSEQITMFFATLDQIKSNLEEQIRLDKDKLNERKEGKQ